MSSRAAPRHPSRHSVPGVASSSSPARSSRASSLAGSSASAARSAATAPTVARLDESHRLAAFDLAGIRRRAIDEGAQLRLGQHADEGIDRPPVHEGHHVRNATDAELRGKLRVLVQIDLHQAEAPGAVLFEALEHRAERTAGAAPRRPEVDQHGDFVRRINDVPLECISGGVQHLRFPFLSLAAGGGGRPPHQGGIPPSGRTRRRQGRAMAQRSSTRCSKPSTTCGATANPRPASSSSSSA